MRKILAGAFIAVFLGVLGSSIASAHSVATVKPAAVSVDLLCMSNAAEKRDNALIAAHEKRGTAVVTALGVRRDALKAAWLLSDATERKAAIKAAWKAFRASYKTARKTFLTERHVAWKVFRADVKACNTKHASNDSTTEDVENDFK